MPTEQCCDQPQNPKTSKESSSYRTKTNLVRILSMSSEEFLGFEANNSKNECQLVKSCPTKKRKINNRYNNSTNTITIGKISKFEECRPNNHTKKWWYFRESPKTTPDIYLRGSWLPWNGQKTKKRSRRISVYNKMSAWRYYQSY